MNLVSMKQDMSSDACCAPCPSEAYPYGLRICLSADQCELLGIQGPISAGTRLSVQALVTVVMCREEAEADPAPGDTKNDISLDLQITDMGIAAPDSMYPNSMMKD